MTTTKYLRISTLFYKYIDRQPDEAVRQRNFVRHETMKLGKAGD